MDEGSCSVFGGHVEVGDDQIAGEPRRKGECLLAVGRLENATIGHADSAHRDDHAHDILRFAETAHS
jgi:hypothetical protein